MAGAELRLKGVEQVGASEGQPSVLPGAIRFPELLVVSCVKQ